MSEWMSCVQDRLIGHERARSTIEKMFKAERIPNGFCFAGPEGVGKCTAALMLVAMDISDTDVQKDFVLPQNDPQTEKFRHQAHPDVYVLTPDGKSITIEQIREMQKALRYRPILAKRRWILIDNAHLCNANAQNALLRTLEEPPANTHFILITPAYESLLPTIRSRCVLVRFGSLSQSDTFQVFTQSGVSESDSGPLTALAAGCPGKALQWNDESILEMRKALCRFLEDFSQNPHSPQGFWETLKISRFLQSEKQNNLIAIEILVSLLRDIAILQHPNQALEPINRDLIASLSRIQIPLKQVLAYYQVVLKAKSGFRFNTHVELTFNHAFISWANESTI